MKKAFVFGVIATAALTFNACTEKTDKQAPVDDFTMEQLADGRVW